MKAVAYTRVSSYQQIENTSLEQQKEVIEKYCKAKNIELVEIFREEAESAKILNRPVLKEAVEYCRKNKVDYFYVYKYDRVSRDLSNHLVIKAWLEKSGTTLQSITEPVEDTPAGRLLENMLAMVAQFENEMRFERFYSGIVTTLKSGRWTFMPATGYSKKDKKIITNWHFPYIVQIFKLYLTGNYSQEQIRLHLKVQGYKISKQKISAILRNPFYANRLSVKEWGVDVEGSWIPAISYANFEKIQIMLGDSKPHFRYNPDFPLNKIIICNCGKPLCGGNSKGNGGVYSYYSCRNSICKAKIKIKPVDADNAYIRFLEKIKPDEDLIELIKEYYTKELDTIKEQAQKDVNSINKNMLDLLKKKETILEYLENKVYDIPTYNARIQKVNTDIGIAQIALSDAQIKLSTTEISISQPINLLRNLPKLITTTLDIKHRAVIQKVLFPYGIRWENGEFTTIGNEDVFSQFEKLGNLKKGMVPKPGHIFNQIINFLNKLNNVIINNQVNLQGVV